MKKLFFVIAVISLFVISVETKVFAEQPKNMVSVEIPVEKASVKEQSKTSKAVEATKEATDKTVKATKEFTDKAVKATKKATKKTVDATKEFTDKTVENTKEVFVSPSLIALKSRMSLSLQPRTLQIFFIILLCVFFT